MSKSFSKRWRSLVDRSAGLPKRNDHPDFTSRQRAIMDVLVVNEGFARVSELSAKLGVSEHTVRRDLNAMEEVGSVERVRGGVILRGGRDGQVPHLFEKRRIGKAAAALIRPGEIVCIDAGSTTFEVARNLPTSGIGILTNAVNIAYEIATNRPDVNVTLTGGSVVGQHGSAFGLSGPIALQSVKYAGAVSKAIIGAVGLDTRFGASDRWHYLAEIKREMIRIAETTILVMDSSKIGTRYLEFVCPLDDIDSLVTDSGISQEARDTLEKRGVNVIVC